MFTPEITHLHQLCRLEMPGTLLASVLFQELKGVIPCAALTLLWQEPESPTARLFHESDTEVNCGSIDAQSFRQLCCATNSELCAVLGAEHPLLQEVAHLLAGVHDVVEQDFQTLAVCLMDIGKRTGAILLHRPSSKLFTTLEKALLVRLAPTLSSSLSVNIDPLQLTTSESNAGILLLNCAMEIQYSCCRGRKLMQLAQAPLSRTPRSDCDNDLAHELRSNFGPENIMRASNFVFHNGWGSFEFCLHQLTDSEIRSDQLTAVAVHRQEPLALSVFRGCRKLGLTEKQIEIALLLIKGLSNEAVATKLSIKSTTVADHVRKIYQKVGAVNRSELVTTLLLGAKKTPSMWPLYDAAGESFQLRPSLQPNQPAPANNKIKGTVRGNTF